MANKQEFVGEITGYGYDGEGIARIDGKVIFIPYALVGEKVVGEIEENRSTFCRGRLIQIKEKSDVRIKAPCPYFGRCGGCAYQHTTYQNELKIKKELLTSQLKKIGIDNQIEVVASHNEYGYRNKIRLFVNDQGLCLKERASNNLCKVDRCLLVSEDINRAIEIIDSFIKAMSLYNVYSQVVIRQEGENLCVNFFLKRKRKIDYQGLYLRLGANFGIFETYNGKCEYKIGLRSLESEEFGLKCSFTPQTFHQVNKFLTSQLYKKAIESLSGLNVVNCYSGAGVLSGAIAKSGKRVIGIELGESEHNDAEELKDKNSLFYLSNLRGDCAKVLPNLSEKIDSIIVDPPRSGMDKRVITTLNDFDFKKLIYISCNSATLVRDIERLKGFKVLDVYLFDMFARTGEYEVLVVLEKI